jgi:hypothetical protein
MIRKINIRKINIRKINAKPADWWSRRAVAESHSPTSPDDVPNSVAPVVSGEARDGWDPWDVWLRRIDQPRRRRTDGESSRD